MRRALTSGFLAFLFALGAVTTDRAQQPAPPPPPEQEPPPTNESNQTRIIQTVNLVDVLFTVLNRRNKLVPDLEKNDFKISDDKIPQAIRYFSKQTDLPLRIGLLLDTSNSIRDRLTARVAEAFEKLDRRGLSDVAIMPGVVGAGARALGGAALPLIRNFGRDREVLLKDALSQAS